MSDVTYKKFLSELTELLKPDLVVTDLLILDEFVENGYLSADDDSSIRKLRRQKKQVAEFVRLIGKCQNPAKCFNLLLTCLETTNAYLAPQIRCLLSKYAGCLEEKSSNNSDQKRHRFETEKNKHSDSLSLTSDILQKKNNDLSSDQIMFCSSYDRKQQNIFSVNGEINCSVRATYNRSSNCSKQKQNSNPESLGCRQEHAPAEMSYHDWSSNDKRVKHQQQKQNCLALLKSCSCMSFHDHKLKCSWVKHVSCHDPIPDFKHRQDRIPTEMSCHSWKYHDRGCNREEQNRAPIEMSWHEWGSYSFAGSCRNPEQYSTEHNIPPVAVYHSMSHGHLMEPSTLKTEIRPIILQQQNRDPVQVSYDTLNSPDLNTSAPHSDGYYDEAKFVSEQPNSFVCNCFFLETERKDQNNNLNSIQRDDPAGVDGLDNEDSICKSHPYLENNQHSDTVPKTCTGCLAEVSTDEHSSESETNTDICSSDLDGNERRVYACLQDVDVIELSDACIANGYLSSDDYNAVKDLSDYKKRVFLSRMVCEKANLDEKGINLMISSASVKPCSGVLNFVRKVNDKQFNIVFDELNMQLNKTMKFDDVVENDDLKRFVKHTLQAFMYLYELNTDAAEHQIDKADEIIKKTNPESKELFRSEIFSARTWLYLRTGRIGLMLSVLEENEQHLEIMNCWSAKTTGWFYYDYSRCCCELLKRSYSSTNINFRNIETIRERGIRCALRARDYFESSKSTDGPIGQGFALCLFAQFQLKFDNRFGYFHFQVSDYEKNTTQKALEYIETKLFRKFSEVPNVLKVDFLISRCDLLVCNKTFREAVTCLTEADFLCRTLNLQDMQRHCLDRLAHLKKYTHP